MDVIINGEPQVAPDGAALPTLIEHLGLAGRRLAVELNGDIVPRSQWGQCALSAGDRIEIVHAIGGG